VKGLGTGKIVNGLMTRAHLGSHVGRCFCHCPGISLTDGSSSYIVIYINSIISLV